MTNRFLLCASTGLLLLITAAGAAAQPAPRPNIILIVADDLGYGELGSYGQRIIQTPNLDRLASEGLRFTQFYAGSTVCAPSRSVLMTGLHAGHTRVRGNAGAGNYAPQTLAAGDVTVARVLEQAGYATALIGKWGLGETGSEGAPNQQGFDDFFGFVNQTHAHNHYPDFLWRNTGKVALPNVVTPVGGVPGAGYATVRVQYANDLFFDEARGFIERSKDRPFFLFLALTVPHANNERSRALGDGQEVPDYGLYAGKDWANPLKGQAAMITRMDRGVGDLMAQLTRLGLDDRTLVVFTSDNGPHNEGGPSFDPDFFDANGPLRGIKRSLTDGGIRVPFLARWPGRIAAGAASKHVGYFGDLMTTFSELAGATAPANLDSLSLVPTLLGRGTQARHDYLYWEFYESGFTQGALVDGRWKGIRLLAPGAPIQLYDLANDPGETADLAATQPAMVERIANALRDAHVDNEHWKWPAPRAPWIPDRGDGTFTNPVIYADYSDPDVVRVGNDFYMTASSMNTVPGLPILHSRDLVNWTLVGHALPRLVPDDVFSAVQPGKGVWAPAIRHHDGKFWIYYPDPDYGIYVVTATNPAGPWTAPILVKAGKGRIDPCPLWDDDGKVYLVHAWARSRAGFNNVLTLLRLTPDGLSATDEGTVIINGDKIAGYRTLEGPKFYKRNGEYWVFAPAGGVKPGWQSVFRSRAIEGPYDDRIVLEQGKTDINGPHQGAWVTTPGGDDWFIHFQDLNAYGRLVHLQPMTWRADGWPVMGTDADGDGRGEPVRTWKKPAVRGAVPIEVPATSDQFDAPALGLQWQWQANPRAAWLSLAAARGSLRLFSQPAPSADNLWLVPNLLLQKLPAPEFTATTVLRFSPRADGESAGLLVFGQDYAWVGLRRSGGQVRLVVRSVKDAKSHAPEQEVASEAAPATPIYLRVTVAAGGLCRFSAGSDPERLTPIGGEFVAKAGDWVVAKVGVFASGQPGATGLGHADWDWFRVEAPAPR